MKTIKEIREIVSDCNFNDYTFLVEIDGRGEIYLQGTYAEADVVTRRISPQFTRRWLISPHMTKSEIVQTVFKCAITSMEHRTREWFTYKGRAVFCPHFNVDDLWKLAGSDRMDRRENIPGEVAEAHFEGGVVQLKKSLDRLSTKS